MVGHVDYVERKGVFSWSCEEVVSPDKGEVGCECGVVGAQSRRFNDVSKGDRSFA